VLRPSGRPPQRAATPSLSPGTQAEASAEDSAASDPILQLDAVVAAAVRAGANGGGLREPPPLVIEGPKGAARRKARDERDGVETAEARRRPIYAAIALFLTIVLFAMLALIELGEGRGVLTP
jgi:hypothetical protein